MNLHPLVPNTVALWQLQSDLKDSSGNGFDLVSVNRITNAPQTAPAFVPLSNSVFGVITDDACLFGSNMVGNGDDTTSKLAAPVTPALQFTGACTFEWLMYQRQTYGSSYIACADPAGRSGGNGPDRIGSLYTLWTASGTGVISDQHMGSALPFPGYGTFPPGTNDGWARVNIPQGGDWSTHHFAFTRDVSGLWLSYRDGISTGTGVPSVGTNVATGVEQVFVGGIETSGADGCAVFASFRILNYARSPAQILTDALITLTPCGQSPNLGNPNAGGGNPTGPTSLVYDAVAAAQFGMSLRQAPRS